MRAARFNKHDILQVFWNDIVSDSKWKDEQEIAKVNSMPVVTIGFFVMNKIDNSGKYVIVLAHSVTYDKDCDYTCIPYGCIRKIKRIKTKS